MTNDLIDRPVVAWMLGAFIVTFLATRLITRMIKAGKGPFRDMSVGGVHLHHQVFGIFLLLITGSFALAYQPAGAWLDIAAIAFGIGAALTLDEFALWLSLDDVYWGAEGRRSVDAVLIAAVIGGLLLIGISPLEDDAEESRIVGASIIAANLVFALIAILKGRTFMGIIGVFIPLISLVAACRVAHPQSAWGRRFYRDGSKKRDKAQQRFPEGKRHRWDPVVDLFAGRS